MLLERPLDPSLTQGKNLALARSLHLVVSLDRAESHRAVLEATKARLLGAIPRAAPERLVELLEACFPYVGLPELREVRPKDHCPSVGLGVILSWWSMVLPTLRLQGAGSSIDCHHSTKFHCVKVPRLAQAHEYVVTSGKACARVPRQDRLVWDLVEQCSPGPADVCCSVHRHIGLKTF